MEQIFLLSVLINARDQASMILARFGLNATSVFGVARFGALAVGAAILAIGDASIKAATEFDYNMQKIAALTDTSQSQMESYKASLLAMAPALDQTPTDLAKGLYFVISAGYKGADALNILKLSANAAASTMTPMKDVADLLTTAMNAYRGSNVSAGHAMDDIIQTVVQGKVEMKNLATSMGFVLVTAKNAGLSIDEASAAVSTLSQVAGAHGSRRVMMDLDNALRSVGINMEKVSAKAKAMKNLKEPWDAAKFAAADFIGKLQYMAQETGGIGYLDMAQAKAYAATGSFKNLAQATAHANANFMSLVGGAAAFLPTAMLLSDKGAEYSTILASMGGNGDKTTQAFNKMRESTQQQRRMFEIMVKTIETRIGENLLPAMNRLLSGLYKIGEQVYKFVSSASGWEAIKSALLGIGTILGVLLVPVLAAFVAWIGPFLIAFAAVVAIGIKLGPVIQALVVHFGGWHAILGRVHLLIVQVHGVLMGLGNAIAFVRQHMIIVHAALSLVAAILIYMAGVAIVNLVTALPALLIMFALWAQGALAAAVATIAAAAPVVLIVAAIALLILGIYELVTHWKQVTSFLGGVWHAVATKAADAWHSITKGVQGAAGAVGGFFAGVGSSMAARWSTITTVLANAWHSITSGVTSAWNGITSALTSAWNGIVGGVQKAVGAIAGAFVWLYNHNYWVQALVILIRMKIDKLAKDLHDAWNGIVKIATAAWTALHIMATVAWSILTKFISDRVNDLKTTLAAIWEAISIIATVAWSVLTKFISDRVNDLKITLAAIWTAIQASAAFWWGFIHATIIEPVEQAITGIKNAWNAVVAWLGNLFGSISTAIHNGVVKPIGDALGNLGDTIGQWAATWGQKLIDNLIQGIKDNLGKLKKSVGDVAGHIKDALGFHSPTKVGPGADADQWAPNFIRMYSRGLITGVPQITQAAGLLAAGLAGALGGTGGSSLAGVASGAITTSIGSVNMHFPGVSSGAEIESAFNALANQRERDNYRRSKRPGWGGGLTAKKPGW